MTATEYAAHYLAEAEFDAPARPWGGRPADALVILIPASQFIEFQVVGRLFAPDILLLAVLPFLLGSRRAALARKLPRTFLILALVWLLAQVTTDLIRATPFQDYARGWAMIAFTLTNFTALCALLSENSYRIILFTFGSALGGILSYFLDPGIYAAGDPWKFGYGYAVTLLLVLIAVFLNSRGRRMLAVAVITAAAALNLYEGFRSLAGECFVAAMYLLYAKLLRPREERVTRTSPLRALLACAILAVSAAGLVRIYAYCAGRGLLGYAAWHKYEIQSSGRYGVLVGGRSEFFTGLEAAMDSPIVGYGSWAKDWRYSSRQEALLSSLGYRIQSAPDSWLIPTHSYLVGAWVDAGIMGALFWLWVLSLPLRVLARLYTADEPLAPLGCALFAVRGDRKIGHTLRRSHADMVPRDAYRIRRRGALGRAAAR
jgi:hypothetical protein